MFRKESQEHEGPPRVFFKPEMVFLADLTREDRFIRKNNLYSLGE
jgi:hypothetical protein